MKMKIEKRENNKSKSMNNSKPTIEPNIDI